MKRIVHIFTLILFGLIVNPLTAQDYQARMTNFVQVSEMEFRYDIQIRNISGTTWAYNSSQFQIDINANMLNGGQFDGVYLTVDNTVSSLPVGQRLSDIDHFYSIPNTALATNSPSTAGGSELLLMSDDSWKTIARFVVKLRNAAGTGFLNFADVDPQFSFRFSDVIVFKVDYYMDGSIARRGTSPGNPGSTSILSKTAGDLIVVSPDRQLAGYWFYQTNTWDVATNWNQVLKAATPAYTQAVPGATNNGVVVGAATVTDLRQINQLTIADGGYLVLSGESGLFGHLTVNDELFNDNQAAPPKEGEVTIAGWDFQTAATGQIQYPYKADYGIAANLNVAPLTTSATPMSAFDFNASGGTIAPRAQNWYFYDEDEEIYYYYSWNIQISTLNYEDLTISSKQRSVSLGPLSFKLQWSLNSTTWNDVTGGSITIDQGWTTGSITNLSLPSDLNDQANVYFRWLNTSLNGLGSSAIDDIYIIGKEIPPPPSGILIQSTAAGTGSLLHNTAGIEATIERYLPAAGYHLVSIPFTQASNPVSGWFIWSYLFNFDVPTQAWVAMGSPTGTPLNVDQGYMVYKYPGPEKFDPDTTYAHSGLMNNGAFGMPVAYYTATVGENTYSGFNLVPNPYPSALDWTAGGWVKTNLTNAIWIWNEGADVPIGPGYVGNYAAYIDGTGTNGGSPFIPVGQSFFVQVATDAAATLSVSNAARVHSTQPFFKDEVQDLLRIQAKGNNYSDEIVVRFVEESTNSFDSQFDASKMYGKSEAPQLYSIAADSRNLSINSLPFTSEVISIPVGFTLSVAGEVTFEASSIDSFDPEVTIFLSDMLTGTMTDLRTTPQYTFMHSPENNPVRFALVFNSSVGVDEMQQPGIRLYAANNNLYLTIPETMAGQYDVLVYNVEGRQVFGAKTNNGTSVIGVPRLGQGIYLVKLVSENHLKTEKVFLR